MKEDLPMTVRLGEVEVPLWGVALVVFSVSLSVFMVVVTPFTVEDVTTASPDAFNDAFGRIIILVTGVIGLVAGYGAIRTRDGFFVSCAVGFSGFSLLLSALGILISLLA
jgi:hypothetical protein